MINFFNKDDKTLNKEVAFGSGSDNHGLMTDNINFDPSNNDYDSYVNSLIESYKKGITKDKEGKDKDPIESLYNTALDITQKQISNNEDKKGD